MDIYQEDEGIQDEGVKKILQAIRSERSTQAKLLASVTKQKLPSERYEAAGARYLNSIWDSRVTTRKDMCLQVINSLFLESKAPTMFKALCFKFDLFTACSVGLPTVSTPGYVTQVCVYADKDHRRLMTVNIQYKTTTSDYSEGLGFLNWSEAIITLELDELKLSKSVKYTEI